MLLLTLLTSWGCMVTAPSPLHFKGVPVEA